MDYRQKSEVGLKYTLLACRKHIIFCKYYQDLVYWQPLGHVKIKRSLSTVLFSLCSTSVARGDFPQF